MSRKSEELQWAVHGLQESSSNQELLWMSILGTASIIGFVLVSLILHKAINRNTPSWKKDILLLLLASPLLFGFTFLLIYGTISGWKIFQFIILFLAALPIAAVFQSLSKKFDSK